MNWHIAMVFARHDARILRTKQYVYGVRLNDGRWVYGVSWVKPR